MQEKDHNYAKELLNYFDIGEEDFKNFNDQQIKEISNKFSTAEVLDKQSGIKKGNDNIRKNKVKTGLNGIYSVYEAQDSYGFKDTGGASKILHKCDFEKNEHDLYLYCPKVSKQERNAGCEDMEEKATLSTSNGGRENIKMTVGGASLKGENKIPKPTKNNHPCLKPISLNRRILELFKTPNPQKIIYPFAGSFSEVIGGYKAGFKDFIGCEISEEYIKIGEARFKHYKNEIDLKNRQKQLF